MAKRGEVQRYYVEVVLAHDSDDCLIWPFGNTRGRGRMSLKGRGTFVSRQVCEEVNGPPPNART